MVSFTRAEFIRLSSWLLVFLMPLLIRLSTISAQCLFFVVGCFFFFLTINILSPNNQLALYFFLMIREIDWGFRVFFSSV